MLCQMDVTELVFAQFRDLVSLLTQLFGVLVPVEGELASATSQATGFVSIKKEVLSVCL